MTSQATDLSHGPSDSWSGAPFEQALAAQTQALLARLTPEQRLWLIGYLAGSLATAIAPAAGQPRQEAAAHSTTILFGSQSGNGEGLARRLAQRLDAAGKPSRLLDMLDCRKADLEQAGHLLVIVSTHGEGEPPERAVPLFELIAGRRAPTLAKTSFAVLALGDTSYEQFCAAGRRLDARLEELGANRLLPRVDCDVEFEQAATQWMDSVAQRLNDDGLAKAVPSLTPASTSARVAHAWTRRHPFNAEVLANDGLTARGSSKEVRHVELSLEGSGLHYEPGDALGIVPANAPDEVDALLARLGFAADEPVEVAGSRTDVRGALLHHLEIGSLSVSVLRRYAQETGDATLVQLLQDTSAVERFVRGHDLRDLVTRHPPRKLDASTFTRLLAPLAPRLYSIASSTRATPDEVHLTIGVVAWEIGDRQRRGVVSGAVSKASPGDFLPVYLHRNEGFRLPTDPATAIVMIGAGTGVAPYRGFLAERESSGATGRNWLLFGDRSFETDFLYQAEWLEWRRRGLLTRLDTAFSRDQPNKVYVQQRVREHGALLWSWIQEGAHLYLCGDAAHMAPDVEQALLDVAHAHGGLDQEPGREWLLELQRARRYQKDVY